MQIRPLAAADIPFCVAIYQRNHNDPDTKWAAMLQAELEASLEPNKFVRPAYFVVEIDGIVVAFAGCANCGFSMQVFGFLWCNVDPAHHGKGIGKLLAEKRIEHVREQGATVILSSQRKAVTWHLERFGFENLGESGTYEGETYYMMRKIL